MTMECRALSVGDLLSGSSIYRMPPFQRAFSWGAEEAVQLYDDVCTAYLDSIHNPDSSKQYFLGQLIVSKARMTAPLDVVDGQQRLVTLSTLIAILRDLTPDESIKLDLQIYLKRPANAAQHLIEQPRVRIRAADQTDYESWVIESGGTTKPNRVPGTQATERLSAAIERIKEEIGMPRPAFIQGLISFLLNNCYVVLTVADNPDDAFKLFRSINARGQPLTELDIIRGEFLSPYSQDTVESTRLAEAWADIQERLGDEGLEQYIVAVTQLVQSYNPHNSLKDTLRGILAHPSAGPQFLTTLRQLVVTYAPLDRQELDFGEHSNQVNRILSCIDALPFNEWRAPVLLWLARKPSAASTLQFLGAVDALGLGLLILGSTKNTIIKRFARLTQDVISDKVLSSPDSAIYFTAEEKKKIRRKIKEPISSKSRFATPLLLRLNAEMLDRSIPTYFPESATLEHILPQKPAPRSQWLTLFPDDERRKYLSQLIGNFAILSSRVNSRAKNYDFERKKNVIFGTADANTFPLTAQLTNVNEWTEPQILQRQDQLTEKATEILRV